MRTGTFAICTVLLVVCSSTFAADFQLEPPGDREFVRDNAELLSPQDEKEIQVRCDKLLSEKATPIIVVTINRMQDHGGAGMRIETFAHMLFDQWQIGHAELNGKTWNTGIMLLVSKGDRKARIELGAGWHRDKDDLCKQIMDEQIIPHFKSDAYSGGIKAGVAALDAMARELELPAMAAAPRPPPSMTEKWGGLVLTGLAVFTIISLLRRGTNGWAWLLWGLLFSGVGYMLYQMMNNRSDRGGFSGGSFGGGSFGGGSPAGAVRLVRGKSFFRSETMQSATQRFTANDRKQINDSVHSAEAMTSAEIVPVVATSSGRYDRAEDLAGLWLGVLMMVAVSILWPSPIDAKEFGSWDSDPTRWLIAKQVLALIVGFVLGAVVCSRVASLGRLFIPARQMADEVQQKAHSVFFDNRVHHTQAGGGLLIYVSLFERVAVILADQQVLEHLGQPSLDELCRNLTGLLRQHQPTDALCQTIQSAGEMLKPVMPRLADDVNELPDSLVTID